MSDEDPTIVTAADYETHIRPYIAALEVDNNRLRAALIDVAFTAHELGPDGRHVKAERALNADITALHPRTGRE